MSSSRPCLKLRELEFTCDPPALFREAVQLLLSADVGGAGRGLYAGFLVASGRLLEIARPAESQVKS